MINKELIVKELLLFFENEKQKLEHIVNEQKELLNEADMKQEGKYDTRAIEAGYLAGAQKKRLEEIQIDINLLKNLKVVNNNKKVLLSSLVKCLINNNKEDLFFISPSSGGMSLHINNHKVHVVCKDSPLGESIFTMEAGDFFEVESPKGEVEYEILEIF